MGMPIAPPTDSGMTVFQFALFHALGTSWMLVTSMTMRIAGIAVRGPTARARTGAMVRAAPKPEKPRINPATKAVPATSTVSRVVSS